MAEANQETCKTSNALKTLVKLIIGVALVVSGLCLGWGLKGELIALIKGCLGPALILVGLVFIAIAKE